MSMQKLPKRWRRWATGRA